MDMINAVENIRRLAESVALSHPEWPDEAMDLADLAERTFQHTNEALLIMRDKVQQEIATLTADLEVLQSRSYLARFLHRGPEKQLETELERASQQLDQLTLEISQARDRLFSDDQSRLRILDNFESVRRNRTMRNDALAVWQAADALLEELRKHMRKQPEFARKLATRRPLRVPNRDAFDLNDALAFLALVRGEMQIVLKEG